MAKLIAEGLGKKLVIKAIGWDGLIPAADSGSIDNYCRDDSNSR